MSNVLTLGNETVGIGIDLSRIYRYCLHSPTVSLIKDNQFPHFEELYEEYVTRYIEEKTNLSAKEVTKEIDRIRLDEFDVENGYRPEMYGMAREAEFYNALLTNNLIFIFKGVTINQVITEVW